MSIILCTIVGILIYKFYFFIPLKISEIRWFSRRRNSIEILERKRTSFSFGLVSNFIQKFLKYLLVWLHFIRLSILFYHHFSNFLILVITKLIPRLSGLFRTLLTLHIIRFSTLRLIFCILILLKFLHHCFHLFSI